MSRMIGNNEWIGLRKAIVKDVAADKSGCNCITVSICNHNKTMLKDVPIAFDMASKGFGRVVMPKEGDNVIVGFFGGDLEQPVILGSFYDPGRKPPIKVDKKNNINYFKTATGLQITIDDSDSKSGVYIETQDGHKLNLSDKDQFVELASKNGKTSFKIDFKNSKIEMKCKDMSVAAENSVSMKVGGNELAIKKGSGVDIKSEGHANVEAKQIKAKSDATFDVKGSKITLNAQGQLEAKANGTASLKSNGMTEIGGSLVKIG